MIEIKEKSQLQYYRQLVREMVLAECEYELDPKWVRVHRWTVVPRESAMRFEKRRELPRIAQALSSAGYRSFIAVLNEVGYLDQPTQQNGSDLDPQASCYLGSTTLQDLQSLNHELGIFRFLLTDEQRSWAISCNESYNLFCGPPSLVSALLGSPIKKARQDFLEFATVLSQGDPAYSLFQIATKYEDISERWPEKLGT